MESMDPFYLILSPLEHSLLLWHRRLGHANLKKIRQAIKTTNGIDLNIPTIKTVKHAHLNISNIFITLKYFRMVEVL
jgi:hypothetical protein